MPLSSRELLLILRARDEASRVVRGLSGSMIGLGGAAHAAQMRTMMMGTALTTMGIGVAAVGAAGVKFSYDNIKAAQEYNKQSALTLTQLDKQKGSLEDIRKVGLDVARSIGAPIEQLQPALFDIFSSMDVSVAQSKKMLEGFAKSAVAGNVDVQVAGRATIAIMNAFHVPAEQVNDVLDFQFQLVRKGVGTYSEFATTIGRAIPSAQRAGQTYQVLGGMLAYMTRNGLSAANASASAARGLDAISNPKVVGRLKDMGIAATDATGAFRPLPDIMADLQKKLSGLTDPQRAAALQDLFKGAGGTIQARRFFDLVTKSGANVQQFTQLVNDMKNSSGALGTAYGQMANQTSSKSQLLKNRFQAMRIEMGNALIPVANKMIDVFSKIFEKFNNLSPHTQKMISLFIALGSVFMIVMGVVLVVVGGILMMSTVFAALSGVGLVVIGVIVLISAVIGALAIKFIRAYQSSEEFRNKVNGAFQTVVGFIRNVVIPVFMAVFNWIMQHLVPAVGTILVMALGGLMHAFHDVNKAIQAHKQQLEDAGRVIMAVVNFILTVAGPTIGFVFMTTFMIAGYWIRTVIVIIGDLIGIIIDFIHWGDAAWQATDKAYQAIRAAVVASVNGIKAAINWFAGLPGMFSGWFNSAKNGATGALQGILNYVSGLPGQIKNFFAGAGSWLIHAGEQLIQGLIDGIEHMLGGLWHKLGGVASKIKGFFPFSPAKHGPLSGRGDLFFAGQSMVNRIAAGMQSRTGHVYDTTGNIAGMIAGMGGPGIQGPVVSPGGGPGSTGSGVGPINIYTQEIDPRRHAADLGWELQSRVG
jgi:TP901 family phage tail tape measure protein